MKLDSRTCEWVEHRDWIFAVEIPRQVLEGKSRILRCLGLDGYGLVFLTQTQVGSFANGYVPHTFDLGDVTLQEMNQLEIVFRDLPHFNGVPFVSSQNRDLKARFNYDSGVKTHFCEFLCRMSLTSCMLKAHFVPSTHQIT